MEPTKHKHPFAKYAGSIDSKLTLKLSEEEIKEQEQEFERIKSFMANHDIPRLRSILFNQTESNNETQTGEENNGVVQRKWRLLHHQPSQRPQRELLEKDAKVTTCLHQREWCICATFNARHRYYQTCTHKALSMDKERQET